MGLAPLTYFKYDGVCEEDYTDGIAPHCSSQLVPCRLENGQGQSFTFSGNSFWASGRPIDAKDLDCNSTGDGWRAHSRARKNQVIQTLRKRQALAR